MMSKLKQNESLPRKSLVRTIRCIFLFALFTNCCSPLDAAQKKEESWDLSALSDEDVLTVDEAVKMALEKNPKLRVAQAQLDLAVADVGEEAAKWLPGLKARIYNAFETLHGQNVMDTGLTLEQAIYTGGKLTAGKKIAALNVIIKESALKQAKQDIACDVTEAYYTAIKSKLMVEAIEASVDRIKDHLHGLEIRLAKDLIPQVEVLKVRAELAKTQKDLIAAKNNLSFAKSNLNVALNIAPESSFSFVKISDYTPLAVSLSECFKIANEYHPLLKQTGIKIETDAVAVAIAQSETLPQVNVFGDFDKRKDVYIDRMELKVGVSGSWNIWDWFKTARTVDQFKAALEETKAKSDIIKNDIMLKIRRDYYRILTDQEQIELSKKVILAAEVEYTNQLLRFKHGQATNTDVLDAQATLTKGQIAYVEALTDSYIARALLSNQTGVKDLAAWEHRGLSLAEEIFLDTIQKKAFLFFLDGQNPRTGLFLDASGGGDSSIAACGMGLTALCIGASRGWMEQEDAKKRTLLGIRAFLKLADGGIEAAEGKWGFFFHFLDPQTGKRAHDSELSTIDTALLIAGAITAGEYFGDEVKEAAEKLYGRVVWGRFLQSPSSQHALHIGMGWHPQTGFLDSYWDTYSDETMLVDLLAIGSSTHPVGPDVFYAWKRTKGSYTGCPEYVCSWQGGLFTYQYAHLWFDFRGRKDAQGVDWVKNSRNATLTGIKFCLDNQNKHSGFGKDAWGITSYHVPKGYVMNHGYPPNLSGTTLFDGTISPSGPAGSIVFTPRESLDALRHFYKSYPKLWGPYGFRDSFNLDENWYSPINFALGTGLTLIAIENFRTGLVWQKFMANPHVQRAMALAKIRRQ